MAHCRPDPQKLKRNLKFDVITNDMVYFTFVCLLFCTIANLRIKCLTEIKNVPALLYKNQASYMTHSFDSEVYLHYWISGPWCGAPEY